MAANYSKTVRFNESLQNLLSIVRSSDFATTLRIEMKSENPTATCVWFRFHHGTSFTSWGEKITITLTPLFNGQTDAHVYSECGMPTQVIDWGKNQQVVCNIIEYIERFAPIMPTAPVINQAPATTIPSPTYTAAPVNQVKYCFKCGNMLSADDIFCGNCGQDQR